MYFHREDTIKGETFQTESEKQQFYSELKAAAESGWDFSSRWFILEGTNQGKKLTLVSYVLFILPTMPKIVLNKLRFALLLTRFLNNCNNNEIK